MALNRPSFVRFNAPSNPEPLPLEPVAQTPGEAPKEPRRPCPSCGNAMRVDAVLCLACGYHQASGERIEGEAAVELPAPIPCWHCGYDLRGSSDEGPCPECAALYDLEFLEQTWTLSYKPSVTMMSDHAQFGELRSINEGRQRRYRSYQNTNKPGDSPATPGHPS